jgi:hypothetical protein
MSECYYCGREATSDEHVPPKGIFPEAKDCDGVDYRKQLITVPSCDDHNSAKTLNDEYLLVLLTLNTFKNAVGQGQFDTKMVRIVRRKPDFVAKILKDIQPITILDTSQNIIERARAFRVDISRYRSILEHIARGLWYYKYSRRFDMSLDVYINGLRYNGQEAHYLEFARAEEELFLLHKDAPSEGANPEVFRYRFVDVRPDVKDLIMIFYGYMMVMIRMGNLIMEDGVGK